MIGLSGATVAQARRALGERFRGASIESPELDARVLIGHVLGLDHAGLAAAEKQELRTSAVERIEAFAMRRLGGEPVARIVGEKEFWGLSFRMTPAVLVPRPETETVVELALSLIDRAAPLRIADLGTGSGAILLALLSELPQARGIGIDIAADALDTARINAERLALADRADFAVCDFAAAQGAFDLVVSNPPYVASGDIAHLAPEVREHDPHRALDGGADGLAAYRTIAAVAPGLLRPDGYLIVEMGVGQEAAVRKFFTQNGLAIRTVRHDLSGISRVLAATMR
ncbi:MAG: peptide chain release factor N(5)-glutamine methyltransferase [Alphaproteobacteria bacterium]